MSGAGAETLESLATESRDVLDSVAACGTRSVTISENGTPERIDAAFVSGAFLSTVGISAAHGRVLTDQDERDGPAGGVVISNALWQRRFGSDPSILGRVLRINDHGFAVVGVLPAGFFGPDVGRAIDVYLPVTAAAPIGSIDPVLMTGYSSTWLRLIGRLPPGVDTGVVSARLTVLLQRYLTLALEQRERAGGVSPEIRQRLRSWRASVEPLGHGYGSLIRPRLSTPLAIAGALVALLLVLVTANVGSLVLGRAVGRQRDIVVRASLGATRTQIVRPILFEGGLLVACGGTAYPSAGHRPALPL